LSSPSKKIMSGNYYFCSYYNRSRYTIELSYYIDLALEFQQQITITPQFMKALRQFQIGKLDYFYPFMKREGISGLQKFMSFDEVRFKF
jgi:hypothetical protein